MERSAYRLIKRQMDGQVTAVRDSAAANESHSKSEENGASKPLRTPSTEGEPGREIVPVAVQASRSTLEKINVLIRRNFSAQRRRVIAVVLGQTLRAAAHSAKSVIAPERRAQDTESPLLKEAATQVGREERALLRNVAALKSLRVDDVMIPRADIQAIEEQASLGETLESFREGQHSRLPVFCETLDDPIGVVHLKDLALVYGFGDGEKAADFALARHQRQLLIVPPSMGVRALLQSMQATRRHMALVIDEYGGVDGLVTIEDILEEIVGDIEDEHDDKNRPLWIRQREHVFLADARAPVADFQEALGAPLTLEDWEEDIDTLGGLVFRLCGRVPVRGEVIQHPEGFEFEIVDADPRRIKRVRVRPSLVLSTEGEAASS